ncbi:MAG: xanthine dehydrogenase family protein subunit M [Burkholderiaceae bacterium]
MYEFHYERPADLSAARRLLDDHPEAKLLAGGMTLVPSLKMRLSAPSHLLDISRLPELSDVALAAHGLSIGAAVTHARIARDAAIGKAVPALAAMAGCIGDPQVRARGTIGGALANNDPAADYPAALLAIGERLRTDRREIAVDDFLQGMFTTALQDDEILCAVEFRIPQRAAYAKFAHPASGYAMTGVMVAQFDDGVRVGVTGAAPCAFRWQAAEQALDADFSEHALAGLTLPADGLNEDLHAPAVYRAHLVSVMARRAVAACIAGRASA